MSLCVNCDIEEENCDCRICEACGEYDTDVFRHLMDDIVLCRNCSVMEDCEPYCPRSEECEWCMDKWDGIDEEAEASYGYYIYL